MKVNVIPDKQLQWELREINDHEKPGAGANETVFGKVHGQQINSHRRTGS